MIRAHHPAINAAVDLVKDVMVKLQIMPYDEETGEGELRYIQAVVTTQHDTAIPVGERYPRAKVQLSLVWNARDEKAPAAELLPEFAEVGYGWCLCCALNLPCGSSQLCLSCNLS